MQISVSGKKLDVGEALREHVETRLHDGVKKYFENAIEADVVFSKEAPHYFRTDIVVNEGTGTKNIIKGDASAGDIYASFDLAADRVEKQLRRFKRKIKNHHKQKLNNIVPLT